jgi:uncharacterized repeat protein (TIGR01451 family)
MPRRSTHLLLSVGMAVLLSQPSTTWAQAPGPDLVNSKSHSGNFTVGTNGIFTIVVSNIGGTASSGQIDVSDPVATNLFEYVSATGTDWSCSYIIGFPFERVQCFSATVIAPGRSAPPITLTIRPIQSGTNGVGVVGGGDTVPSNNNAFDVFIVVPAVPTLPQWAMIVLSVLLALAGVAAFRRRTT